jgi:hypothetical protein
MYVLYLMVIIVDKVYKYTIYERLEHMKNKA